MTETELVRQHIGVAFNIASDFFIPGASFDDVRQEALIGLLQAIRSHDPELGPFRPFAAKVIHRRLMDAVTAALRGKQLPLTQSVREGRDDDHALISIIDLIPDPNSDPADRFERRQELRNVLSALRALPPLERESLAHVMAGREYVGNKRLDNAAYRARAKLKAAA